MISELPLTLVQSLERQLVSATSLTVSPFTGSTQMQDWGGEWWEYRIEMAPTQGRNGRRLAAFLAALGGRRGRFLFRDPSIEPVPVVATPLVEGSGQSGNRLLTSGWPPETLVLQPGDFFASGADAATRLHQITEEVVSDETGRADLGFVPRLRASPPDGSGLDITAPGVVLRLTAPAPARVGRADTWRFTLSAREAF